MTAVHPAQPAPQAQVPTRIPFPSVDEISLHCVQPAEPETVHIEMHLPGRLEEQPLRKAFREAMLRHPRILMRKAPSRWWHRRYAWELTAEPDVDPLSFTPAGPGALERARARTMAECPPFESSPPIRIEVVEMDGGGTALMTTINHTALDGPSFLRVLATAAEIYNGTPAKPAEASAPARPTASAQESAEASAPSRPVRIAADTAAPAPGNDMLLLDLPVPRRTSYGATVNDQLLVATCLMIARWNAEHGKSPRPVQITMPVDNRPRLSADMPIGNGTRLTEVGFGPEEAADTALLTADPSDKEAVVRLLRRTMTRTHALKALPTGDPGHAMGRAGALLTLPVMPVAWRSGVARALRKAAEPWMSTTLVSNVGRVPYDLEFGAAGRSTALWMSAPSRRPRGLTVTVASTGGRLHVALRWSRAMLDEAAGARLAELFQEGLAACTEAHA